MTLVFYKVDNSQDFNRHTFDGMTKEDCYHEINKLADDEFRVYNLSEDSSFFQEDYNDEILDGGWWCVCFTD